MLCYLNSGDQSVSTLCDSTTETIVGKADPSLPTVAAGKHTCQRLAFLVVNTIFFVAGTTVRMFTTEEIEAITANYSAEKEVGKGAFGRVFRGMYHHTEVAVKVLRKVIIVML